MSQMTTCKPLTLHAHEVRRLHAAGSVTLWRPVTPQPEQRQSGYWWFGKKCFAGSTTTLEALMEGYCPHGAPGETRWCREVWGFSAKLPVAAHTEMAWLAYHDMRGYRADNPPGNWCWRSPVTQPRWAARCTVRVTGVVVKRVRDASGQDIGEAGFPGETVVGSAYCWWKDGWSARYGDKYPYPDAWAWGIAIELAKESE